MWAMNLLGSPNNEKQPISGWKKILSIDDHKVHTLLGLVKNVMSGSSLIFIRCDETKYRSMFSYHDMCELPIRSTKDPVA